VNQGIDRIEIQLKPAALGRVDVRLEVTHDGRVTAVVAADTRETLDMLQRDARTLERALQDAGLRMNSGDLSFSMRGHERRNQASDRLGPNAPIRDAEGVEATLAPMAGYALGGVGDGRLDIRV